MNYGSDKIFACNHPIFIEVFKSLHLLYDPMHLHKNIKNNLQAEIKNSKIKG